MLFSQVRSRRFSIFPTFNCISVLSFILLILLSTSVARAADVSFVWDPNTEQDLAGYEFYYGTSSGTYSSSEKLGNVTTFTKTGLKEDRKYFFALKAYDTADNRSPFSDPPIELYIPDVTPPSIVSVQSAGDPNRVVVRFSEPVDKISATNESNYTIDNDIQVLSALIDANLTTVTLNTSTHRKGIVCSLSASDILDKAKTPNVIDPNKEYKYSYTSLVIDDDFSNDTTGNYSVKNTLTKGGTGSLLYDSTGKRAQILTGDNIGLQISDELLPSDKGSFSIDFRPTVQYPYGGQFILRLVQDGNNYYELVNTDGYGAGKLTKFVNGIDVDSILFANEYEQNNNYAVTIDFNPDQTTANAFGESVSISKNDSVIMVNRFEIELMQQDAFLDNIKFVVNNQPIATDDTASTLQNTSININVIANDVDADGAIINNSVAIATTPASGTSVSNSDGTVTYTPNAGHVGADSFQYTVSDNFGAKSNIATVYITINAPNEAPDGIIIKPNSDVTIKSGESVNFEGTGTDLEDKTGLKYRWNFGDASIPDSTTSTPGLITFNNEGEFTVTLTVTDTEGLSDAIPATVQINVEKRNEAPDGIIIKPNSDVTIKAGESVNFAGTGTDPDPEDVTTLKYRWNFGDASIPDSTTSTPGLVTFNTEGVFTVMLTVTDSAGLSDETPATVQIKVEKRKEAPDGIITNPTSDVTIKAGESVNFAGTGTDPDPEDVTTLKYRWNFGDTSIPDSTTSTPGLITFNNKGVFTVTLTVTDSDNLSDATPATLKVTVEDVVDSSFFDDFSVNTIKDYAVEHVRTSKGIKGSFTYDAGGKRAKVLTEDNVTLQFSRDLPPLIDGRFTIDFLPTKIYPKGGTFSLILRQDIDNYYQLTHTDGYGPGNLDKYIGGKKVDSAALKNKYSQNNNYSILISFGQENTTVDAFGESVSISSDSNSITVNKFEIEIMQQDAYFDNISYISNLVANKQPVATDDNAVTLEDTFVDVNVITNDNDVDGFIMPDSVAIVDPPVNGNTLVYLNGTVNYTPNSGFAGDDTFTYTVKDDLGKVSNIATVNIKVKSKNQEPNGEIKTPIGDQTISVGDSINFIGMGTDVDNNFPLTYSWNFGDPAIPGSSSDTPGLITFNNAGVFTVSFAVTDSTGFSDATPATINVTVKSGTSYFSDDFSVDTTSDYTVVDTLTKGGTGSLLYDSLGERAQILTGDNVGLKISQNLQALESGIFSIDFLPTAKYPYGSKFTLRLMQDVNNYYELLNTDGYGPGQLIKYVNGVKVDSVQFTNEFSLNNNYTVVIEFSSDQTTIDAFGETISINTDDNTIIVNSFEVELMQQDAYLDNIVYFDSGSNGQPSTINRVDDFSADTTGNYSIKNTMTKGGKGSLLYDSLEERAQILTGDNIGLEISQDLEDLERGIFSIDFLPTAKYPYGSTFTLRLVQDANNYYELLNTDGYGPGQLIKYVNGVKVDSVQFVNEFSLNNNYTVVIDFSPEQTTIEAFGETIFINTDDSSIMVNSFAVELMQQDAYLDNIIYKE